MVDTHWKNYATSLTNEVLVDHLRSVASDVRFLAPAAREALLLEAASRLTGFEDALLRVKQYGVTVDQALADINFERQAGQSLVVKEPSDEYVAWITTDHTCLAGDNVDVGVTRNGEHVWSATTTVDARDGDPDEALRQCKSLLADARWFVTGDWLPVDTGSTATVEPIP